ncbi:hypothetical protein Fmac_029367 [Flemingia macrophylla]|uniref:Uncharacterized protein n=1 Tax=Flemingia macrophylla TaxID=520843 RepID=A0ABD1LA46_9FABA
MIWKDSTRPNVLVGYKCSRYHVAFFVQIFEGYLDHGWVSLVVQDLDKAYLDHGWVRVI